VTEWMPWPWEPASRDPAGSLPIGRRQEATAVPPGPGAESSDMDAWLMELIYRNIAATSWCEICGCRFARRLRVLPAPAGLNGVGSSLSSQNVGAGDVTFTLPASSSVKTATLCCNR
jgi:hypothetical protein